MAEVNGVPMIRLEDLSLAYERGGQKSPVLVDVDLTIEKGQFIVIVGPSGVGKSTLLRVIAGLLPANTGRVQVMAQADPHRRPIGLVFQEARMLPWRRVGANVEFGLEGLHLSASARRERAEAALALVGMDGYADRWPYELSGGQRQRVGIARALAVEPDVLLMDEPFGALDAVIRRTLQDEMVRLWQTTHKTVVFVTHDLDEAAFLADRVIVLGGSPARVVEDHICATPRHLRRHEGVNRDQISQLAASLAIDDYAV